MSERAIHLGILVSALAASAWAFGTCSPEAPPGARSALKRASAESAPLTIIPPGAAFVLTADVRHLLRAPLGTFLVQRLEHFARAAELTAQCGFDPLARLDRLALAVPSAGLAAQEHPEDRGSAEDFGIVAGGRFSASEISHCATVAIQQRGGEPVATRVGSFSSVRDRKIPSGEIAARDGLLIVSGGSYFRELLDAAEGRGSQHEQELLQDARHAELRRALGVGPLLGTWLLSEGWLERVSGVGGSARLSALSALSTVAARIDLDRTARVTLLLDSKDSEGARRIESLLGELRSSLRLLALDPALSGAAQRISVSRNDVRLTLTLELTQAELTALLDLALGP